MTSQDERKIITVTVYNLYGMGMGWWVMINDYHWIIILGINDHSGSLAGWQAHGGFVEFYTAVVVIM